MERVLKLTGYIVVVAGVVVALAYFYANAFYLKMVAEDGVFEYATALILLLISVLFLVRIIKMRTIRNNYWLVLNVFIVLGAFFGFGEEVSWGQRIFSIESGEFFMEQNLQAETNLHNLEINGVSVNKLIFSQGLVLLFGFYFVFSQLLYRKWGFFTNLIDLFGVQVPKIKHSIIILLSTAVVLMVPESRIWELWEAIFVALLLLVFIDPYNIKERLLVYTPEK